MNIFGGVTTFAERQRAVALWAMIAAGIFAGLMIVAILSILVWGGWPPALYRLIIYVIAGGMAGFVLSMIAVILALAVGGPVGRFKLEATRSGASFEADRPEPLPVRVEQPPDKPVPVEPQ